MEIVQLAMEEARQALPQLCTLLQDAVASGASVGFLPPLSDQEARAYWEHVLARIATPDQLLFVARHGQSIIGTVQLTLETRPNGSHRAEVSKLLVHTAVRGRGVAKALMQRLETAASKQQRSLLVLDTRAGDVAEQLYLRLGYLRAGTIPGYARSADGTLDASVFMYKQLAE